ncbi:MAG TPA: hypothetical protein VLF67_04510 [Candidatus Saccharimonas sp.]|nr:hypothetical protein [Candidatus Saccharimonas sp.]
MRWWRLAILVVAVALLQVGLVPALRPLGVVPNLVLGLVVLVGIAGTATSALVVAVTTGLLLDLSSGVDFGLRSALLVLAALVAGLVHRLGLELDGPVVALVLVAAGTIVADVAVLAGLVGMTGPWRLGLIAGTIGLELVLNLGCTLLMRPMVRWAVRGEGG